MCSLPLNAEVVFRGVLLLLISKHSRQVWKNAPVRVRTPAKEENEPDHSDSDDEDDTDAREASKIGIAPYLLTVFKGWCLPSSTFSLPPSICPQRMPLCLGVCSNGHA